MKLRPLSAARRALQAFTLIEITIALAVVAFALVAIIGVLPIGLTVQRDNRAETIVQHDGAFWMEAIRGGAQALDELTNYVEYIVIERDAPVPPEVHHNAYLNTGSPTFGNGYEIVGLLSSMAEESAGVRATNVYAVVRSLTGVATEKHGVDTTPSSPGLDFAFKYRLTVQLRLIDPTVVEDFNTSVGAGTPERLNRLYDMRLRFNWPVLKNDARQSPPLLDVGRRQKTFRSMANRYFATNEQNGVVYTFLIP